MNTTILVENEKKRIDYPLSRLICFAMFMVWQMGFIFYMGPALTIDGKTPLPVDMDNTTTLIAVCYILNILWLTFLPGKYVYAARVAVVIALISNIGLFLPLSPDMLVLLLYIQCFCCCFIIGFETATMVFLLSEKTTIMHLLLAYPIGYIIVAILQNDIVAIPFSWFRGGIVIMLIMLIYFYFKLPTNVMPQFVRRSDGLVFPKRLYYGVYGLVLLACLFGVIGPAAAAEVTHGVSCMYLFAALAGVTIYYIYKKHNIHPLKSVSFAIMTGAIGFILLLFSIYIPALGLPACALIGIGSVSCALLPLFGVVLIKQYPSKYIPAIIMSFAIVAVLISSGMLEAFRNDINMLYMSYIAIVVIMAIIYLQLAPYMLRTLNEKISSLTEAPAVMPQQLTLLTERELEVANLISRGYSNRDIAKMLFISEHTVKDHTKNIYRKLEIHSRFELAALINRK